MKRPYAAGAAILLTLLLSTAIGVEWVDVPGGVQEAAPQALVAPPGAAIISGAAQATQPEQGWADGMPLDYIYIDPARYGTNVFPWYYYYSGFRYQELYLASEIGRSGTIAQIALWKTAYTYRSTYPNVSVKLCHTNVTTLSTNFSNNYGGSTPVWVYHQTSGFTRGTSTANQWDSLDLQTMFAYNGTDNLIYEVVWMGSASGTYPGEWYNIGSGNRRAYAYNITDTLPATANGADYVLLNTRIGFQSNPDDVGVSQILSPAEPFFAFGDTFYMSAEVKNFGIAAQRGVPVICRLQEKLSSTVVFDETLFVDLAVGETETLNFPGYYAPPAVEAVFVDTMWTELSGDQGPTNDMKANECKVTEWGSECISYNDGTFDNAISWVAAGNELTERFFAPVTPLSVNDGDLDGRSPDQHLDQHVL